MSHNKTQKTVGGTLTGNYGRGSPFDSYFRSYWGDNQSYNDFVKSLENSDTNYTTGKVMKIFKNDEGHKLMNELNAKKTKQRPPSPKTKKTSSKSPSPKTINCHSSGIEPVECKEPKDLKRQRFIFHPDRNYGCVKDAETKFKRLISDEFPNCKQIDSN